ncbi:hypothetical protein, partial [Kitasatospora sp. NPDC059327]|uniref:hypothetical protein n=1 Tax=Kitasatospora sp. NPDC059327 TaxID=3346803 RepID=UPI0036B1B9D5
PPDPPSGPWPAQPSARRRTGHAEDGVTWAVAVIEMAGGRFGPGTCRAGLQDVSGPATDRPVADATTHLAINLFTDAVTGDDHMTTTGPGPGSLREVFPRCGRACDTPKVAFCSFRW